VLKGEVKVFDLNGQSKAKRCYGWSHPEGEDDTGEQFVIVPVVSAVAGAG
jgi:hypothetical protein